MCLHPHAFGCAQGKLYPSPVEGEGITLSPLMGESWRGGEADNRTTHGPPEGKSGIISAVMVTASLEAQAFIHSQRVARLATTDESGQPHAVPVCFVYNGAHFYTAIDRKPKQTTPLQLKRVRNILANPKVALVLDRYREQWQELAYLMVQGTARIIESGPERDQAVALLREKYTQYQAMALESAPVIEITPRKFIPWGDVGGASAPEKDER